MTESEFIAAAQKLCAFYGFVSCPLNLDQLRALHKAGCPIEKAYDVACDVNAGVSFQAAVEANRV